MDSKRLGTLHHGKRILTGSVDRTARLWDSLSGETLLTLLPFPNGWASLDKRERYLAEGDGLEHIRYYDPEERTSLRHIWTAGDLYPVMSRNEA